MLILLDVEDEPEPYVVTTFQPRAAVGHYRCAPLPGRAIHRTSSQLPGAASGHA